VRPETYHLLARRQKHYWWHRARRAMSLELLRRHGLGAAHRWVDLGCGPGGNLCLLAPLQPALVVGVDCSPFALEFAQRDAPHARLVRADISQGLPFADDTFDVATVFNVLYHEWIISEVEVLSELRRVLRPGGFAVITEPAFASLMREMDAAAMGRRRYRLPEFRGLCQSAGLDVVLASYFTSFGAALLLAMKTAGALTAPFRRGGPTTNPDMKPINPFVNEVLYRAALVEAYAIVRRLPVPFGTTLICLVCKRA
jgi:SAM-dependent methyltransferase